MCSYQFFLTVLLPSPLPSCKGTRGYNCDHKNGNTYSKVVPTGQYRIEAAFGTQELVAEDADVYQHEAVNRSFVLDELIHVLLLFLSKDCERDAPCLANCCYTFDSKFSEMEIGTSHISARLIASLGRTFTETNPLGC